MLKTCTKLMTSKVKLKCNETKNRKTDCEPKYFISLSIFQEMV